jgi:hypothetical protein
LNAEVGTRKLKVGMRKSEVGMRKSEVGMRKWENFEFGMRNVWAKGIEHSVMRKDSLPMIRFSAANR